MSDQTWWYLSRSSGVVTLVASGGAIIWGLLLSTRVIRRRSLPKWLLDLHRFLGAITVAGLAVHLGSLYADRFIHFSIADLAIPGHATWHPWALAWGIIAAYLLVVVQVSSLLKRHIPLRIWRRIHYSSFPVFVLALLHAGTAGTDTSNRAYVVTAFLLCAVIFFLTVVRVLSSRSAKASRPTASRTRDPITVRPVERSGGSRR